MIEQPKINPEEIAEMEASHPEWRWHDDGTPWSRADYLLGFACVKIDDD